MALDSLLSIRLQHADQKVPGPLVMDHHVSVHLVHGGVPYPVAVKIEVVVEEEADLPLVLPVVTDGNLPEDYICLAVDVLLQDQPYTKVLVNDQALGDQGGVLVGGPPTPSVLIYPGLATFDEDADLLGVAH